MAHSLNRRRFLKYAGATATVAGASAIGLGYIANTPRIPIQQTRVTLLTSSILSSTSAPPATSSSSTQLASLQGKLFFDYNGNGKQDGDEPSIGDAKVQLKNALGNLVAEAATDTSGVFKIEDVPVSNYKLFPVAGRKVSVHVQIS